MRLSYINGTPGADANTYNVVNSTLLGGANFFSLTGTRRVKITIKNSHVGTLKEYRSTDRGTTWTQISETAVAVPAASASNTYKYYVSQFNDWKLDWVNGGSAQTTFTVDIALLFHKTVILESYDPNNVLSGTPAIAAWHADYVTGNPVSRADDLTGNRLHLTQSGSGRPTVATDWSDGKDCLAFDRTATQHLLAPAGVVLALTGMQTHSLVAMARYDTAADNNALWGGGSSGRLVMDFMKSSYLAGNRYTGATGTKWGPQAGACYSSCVSGREYLMARTYDSGTGLCQLVRNGIYSGTYDMAVGSLTLDAFALGCTLLSGTTPNSPLNGRVRAACVLDRVCTVADYLALSTLYAGGHFAVFVNEGDSIANGLYSGGSGALVSALNPTGATERYAVSNDALGGDTLHDEMIPEFAAQITPLYDSDGYRDSIVCCNGGGNDIDIDGRTGAEVLADALSWIATALAGGWKVIFCDTMPRTTFSAGEETHRLTLNAGLAAAASGLGANFQLVQWSEVPEAQDPSNATYFSDGVHPTAALYTILAARVKIAADTLTVTV